MVAGPKRKLMNSAPASYCLYSTPGARKMTAMTRGQAITKGGMMFRLKRSMMISLITYRITVRPMPKSGELSKTSGKSIIDSPFL